MTSTPHFLRRLSSPLHFLSPKSSHSRLPPNSKTTDLVDTMASMLDMRHLTSLALSTGSYIPALQLFLQGGENLRSLELPTSILEAEFEGTRLPLLNMQACTSLQTLRLKGAVLPSQLQTNDFNQVLQNLPHILDTFPTVTVHSLSSLRFLLDLEAVPAAAVSDLVRSLEWDHIAAALSSFDGLKILDISLEHYKVTPRVLESLPDELVLPKTLESFEGLVGHGVGVNIAWAVDSDDQ